MNLHLKEEFHSGKERESPDREDGRFESGAKEADGVNVRPEDQRLIYTETCTAVCSSILKYQYRRYQMCPFYNLLL